MDSWQNDLDLASNLAAALPELIDGPGIFPKPACSFGSWVGIASALCCSWGGAVEEDPLNQSCNGVSGYISSISPCFPPNASYSHTPFAWHSLTWSPFLLLALTTLYAAWRMRASPIHIWWIVIDLRAVLMVYWWLFLSSLNDLLTKQNVDMAT